MAKKIYRSKVQEEVTRTSEKMKQMLPGRK